MAKLWLHIGSHKTGTTSTQKTLSGSRDVLQEAGLVYPWNKLWFDEDPGTKPRGYAHHYLVPEARDRTLADNLDKIHEGFEGDEWFLSSEVLSTIKRPDLAHLLDAFGKRFDDIRAIMYVREPGDLAVSRTATHIVMGQTTFEAVCEDPKVYRYKRNMTPWLKLLGKDRFVVRVYNKKTLHKNNIVDDLMHVIGRSDQPIALNRATRFVTPSHNAVMAMSERNARGEAHLRGGYRKLEGPPFTLPPEIIDHVRRESADDVAWLRETFGVEFEVPSQSALAR